MVRVYVASSREPYHIGVLPLKLPSDVVRMSSPGLHLRLHLPYQSSLLDNLRALKVERWAMFPAGSLCTVGDAGYLVELAA